MYLSSSFDQSTDHLQLMHLYIFLAMQNQVILEDRPGVID
jgi:hypothetical protein